MDSPWSNPLHLIAFEASRYLAEVFDRKALELEEALAESFKSSPLRTALALSKRECGLPSTRATTLKRTASGPRDRSSCCARPRPCGALSLEAQQRGRLEKSRG